jgi:hypothetical protein
MMTDRCIRLITALILGGSAIVLLTVRPDPLPPIDPERDRAAVRLHLMALEAEGLKRELRAARARIDTVTVIRWRYTVKHDSIAAVRMGQSDSVQAEVLIKRLDQ